jgi:O-antigen/teichoic acid export membrane protein
VILANLQLRAMQATDARREHPFGVYLGLRLATTAAALATIAALAVALGYADGTLAVVLAIGLAKGFEAVSDVTFGLLQQAERLRQIALSMLARGALSVLAVGLALRATGDLAVAMLAMAVVWGAWLAAWDLPQAARIASIRPRFAPDALRALAWLALPLGCVSFLNSLGTNLPRYALEAHTGTAVLGRFAALAYLVVATSQPVVALGAATMPCLARYYATDSTAYRRLARRALGWARSSAAFSARPRSADGTPWRSATATCTPPSGGPRLARRRRALGFLSTALGWAVTPRAGSLRSSRSPSSPASCAASRAGSSYRAGDARRGGGGRRRRARGSRA